MPLSKPPLSPDEKKRSSDYQLMARSTKKPASKKPAKKPASKKPAKKAAPKKAAARKPSVAKKKSARTQKPAKLSRPTASAIRSANGKAARPGGNANQTLTTIGNHTTPKERRLDPFTRGQKEKLLQLRDAMVDSMAGVAQDTLRARAEGSEASAFGMHQADAGSDAYDRDFALSLLSQEQDALYEIDEALKRIDLGTYGKCEMSGKPILRAHLEAIPFARFTVECQSQLEKQSKASRVRQSVTSLFGLTDEEAREGEEEEPVADAKE
jgi:RNA polymerase-binding transcription factor DksA